MFQSQSLLHIGHLQSWFRQAPQHFMQALCAQGAMPQSWIGTSSKPESPGAGCGHWQNHFQKNWRMEATTGKNGLSLPSHERVFPCFCELYLLDQGVALTIRVLEVLEICSDSKQQMGQGKDSETSSRDLSKRSARRRCCSKFRRHACRWLGPHRACLQARETQKSSTPRPTWICL